MPWSWRGVKGDPADILIWSGVDMMRRFLGLCCSIYYISFNGTAVPLFRRRCNVDLFAYITGDVAHMAHM